MNPLYTEPLYTDFSELSLLLSVQPEYMRDAGEEYVNHQVWMIQTMMNGILKGKAGNKFVYDVPFDPPPTPAKLWIARIILPKIFERRQLEPTDVMYENFVKDAEKAWDEIKAAGSGDDNVYNLPTIPVDVVTNASIAGYSEYDPKTWYRNRGDLARKERDRRGGGTIL